MREVIIERNPRSYYVQLWHGEVLMGHGGYPSKELAIEAINQLKEMVGVYLI